MHLRAYDSQDNYVPVDDGQSGLPNTSPRLRAQMNTAGDKSTSVLLKPNSEPLGRRKSHKKRKCAAAAAAAHVYLLEGPASTFLPGGAIRYVKDVLRFPDGGSVHGGRKEREQPRKPPSAFKGGSKCPRGNSMFALSTPANVFVSDVMLIPKLTSVNETGQRIDPSWLPFHAEKSAREEISAQIRIARTKHKMHLHVIRLID